MQVLDVMINEFQNSDNEIHPRQILLIDDDESLISSLCEFLTMHHYEVDTSMTGYDALEMIRYSQACYDLIITDIAMKPISGIDILNFAKMQDPDAVIILMTGFVTIESTLEAIHNGAYDYLKKPFKFHEFLFTVQRGIERRKLVLLNRNLIENLRRQNTALQDTIAQLQRIQDVIVHSARCNAVNETVVTVRHEITNPLMGISTKLQLLMEEEYAKNNNTIMNALRFLKSLTDRIELTLKKLDHLERPTSTEYISGVKMIDIQTSCEFTGKSDDNV